MSKYHSHGINLNDKQFHSLAQGGKIIVKHGNLHGSHEVRLTKTQLTKLHKHHKEGKNFPLQMSQTQLKHHMSGGGFFGDLVKKVKSGVSKLGDFLQPHAKNLAHSLVEQGAHHAKEYVHNKISDYGKEKATEAKVPQPKGPPVMSAPVVITDKIPVAPPMISSRPKIQIPQAPPMISISKPKTKQTAQADLLSQIREGTRLKKSGVSNKMEVKKQNFAKDTKVDPMDDLRRRLAIRRSKLQGDGIKRRKKGKGFESFLPMIFSML